ncbi:acyl-CoA dehydrogenase family protein [Alphaproteobacteria bacterium]|jgi:alkylation response protein AidB-like acyl-CoA dehydrogenase|nr:acyl-CoA dehydrogenase [Rhodospirillaceae bacterium]MBT7730701.1 acyl-CoA dehydrogenase [Rhodospirillaceae bacterium]MDC0998531.1 acyl-CoA dehydrogenase family protein [Alphaproteobacteria bacterium]
MIEHTENSVREEARSWLKDNWNPNLDLFEWRNKLADSGWGLPNWPSEWYGRDLPVGLVPIVEEEFQRIGALPIPKSGIRMLAAATILNHGTEMHKQKFLRRIVTGQDVWCQLFSEPGSGSDLAGATTKAVMVGNKWVVNGQKVWTTSAHKAHWGLLLARTDMDATKHDGLSYFIIDMKQLGVETQPLKQMNGYASFNQVFLTDAEVLPDFQVAELGDGWKVATTTLMHERRAADSLRAWGQVPDNEGAIYDQERAEIETTMAPYKWYPQRAGRVDLIMERAKETGAIKDPAIRQEIAKLMTLHKSAEWTARRARSAQEQGKPQGPEGSLGKLAASNVARTAAKVHTMISGANSMLSGEDSPENGTVSEVLISFPASSIAGGTDEIQKNIISERVLDMPKETRFDAGKPFKDIPRNTIS